MYEQDLQCVRATHTCPPHYLVLLCNILQRMYRMCATREHIVLYQSKLTTVRCTPAQQHLSGYTRFFCVPFQLNLRYPEIGRISRLLNER